MHLYHVVQDHIQKLVNLILLVNFVTEESIVLDMQCLRQILYQWIVQLVTSVKKVLKFQILKIWHKEEDFVL
jgi:hypothetical protein